MYCQDFTPGFSNWWKQVLVRACVWSFVSFPSQGRQIEKRIECEALTSAFSFAAPVESLPALRSNLFHAVRWLLEENIGCTTRSINQHHSIGRVYLQNAIFRFFSAQRMPNDTSKDLQVVRLDAAWQPHKHFEKSSLLNFVNTLWQTFLSVFVE